MTYDIETGLWERGADFYSFEWTEGFPKVNGPYFYADGEDIGICRIDGITIWFIGSDYPSEKQEMKNYKWMGPIPLPLNG